MLGSQSSSWYDERLVVKAQGFIRRHFAIKERKRRAKFWKKRNDVVREIVATELTYVVSLRVVVGVFLNPLLASLEGPTPVLSLEKIRKIFANVDNIMGLNKFLFESLEIRVKESPPSLAIGDLFLQMSPYFKVYAQYCKNYEQAEKALDQEIASNPAFQKFISICSSFPEANESLSSYLVMPVQRIPRYSLLIEDLLRNTWKDHRDYDNLSKALSKLLEVAEHVDSYLGSENTLNKLKRIQTIIGDDQKLAAGHRMLKKDGKFLRIKCRGNKFYTKNVHIYLFTDLLLLVGRSRLAGYKHKTFPLMGLWTKTDLLLPDWPDAFLIIGEELTIAVTTRKAGETVEWLKMISSCVVHHTNQLTAGKNYKCPERDPFSPVRPTTSTSLIVGSPPPLNSPLARINAIAKKKPLPQVPLRRSTSMIGLRDQLAGATTATTATPTFTPKGSTTRKYNVTPIPPRPPKPVPPTPATKPSYASRYNTTEDSDNNMDNNHNNHNDYNTDNIDTSTDSQEFPETRPRTPKANRPPRPPRPDLLSPYLNGYGSLKHKGANFKAALTTTMATTTHPTSVATQPTAYGTVMSRSSPSHREKEKEKEKETDEEGSNPSTPIVGSPPPPRPPPPHPFARGILSSSSPALYQLPSICSSSDMLKEGYLVKKEKVSGRWKRLYGMAQDNELNLYKSLEEKKLVGSIALKGAKVYMVEQLRYENCFAIAAADSQVHFFTCHGAGDLEAWLAILNDTIASTRY